MAFHNRRFPDSIAEGAEGGPEFSTSVAVSSGGREQRNGNWTYPRGRWNVGTGLKDEPGIAELIAFFRVCYGKLHGFRFKDWSDFTMAAQTIGTTDGSDATWQIFKQYVSGSDAVNRPITRPVSGSVRCWVDGVERTLGAGASEFQVNLDTGVITLGSTLAALSAKLIVASCEFDVPARFDTDALGLRLDAFEIGAIPDIPVVELPE